MTDAMAAVGRLLQPIREDAPAGESLRYSPTYDAIAKARSFDAELPQGVWQREQKRSDWREVERLCSAALASKSKDLQLAVWLAEAWVYQQGVAGLMASVALIHGLHDEFLFTMFPAGVRANELGPDAVEHRANLLQNFGDRSAFALKFVPLCDPEDAEVHHAYTLAEVEKLHHDDGMRRRMNLPVPPDKPLQAMEDAMDETPVEWMAALDGSLRECEVALASLDAKLDESYGPQNGGVGQIGRVLEAMRLHLRPRLPVQELWPDEAYEPETHAPETMQTDVPAPGIFAQVRQIFSGRGRDDAENGYDPNAPTTAGNSAPEPMVPTLVARQRLASGGGEISTREEAYECLQQVADFLSHTEPHSPVPFLLRRAIHWGSMDFGDLLPEMMRNPQGLEELNELLRLPRTE